MFVTTPELKLWVPPGISLPGDQHWSAVMLASDAPWFILTVWEKSEEGARFQQSMAVAWEATLRRLLEEALPARLAALSCVRREESPSRKWLVDDISEVWIGYAGPPDLQGTLLFAHRDEQGLFDSHGGAVVLAPSKLRRLVEIGPASPTQSSSS